MRILDGFLKLVPPNNSLQKNPPAAFRETFSRSALVFLVARYAQVEGDLTKVAANELAIGILF